MTTLRRWLRSRDAFFASAKAADRAGCFYPATHACMDGGEIHLPPGSDGEFLTAYADAVHRGEQVAVSEIVTGPTPDTDADARFPMFVDVDLKSETALKIDELDRGLRAMQRAVASAYDGIFPFDVWACAAGGGGDKDRCAVGLHVYFPRCIVNLARAFILNRMIRTHPDLPDDWRTAIDDSVYGSGLKCIHLRMIGSCKIMPCAACRQKRKRLVQTGSSEIECSECHGRGKINLGRVYSLAAVVASDGHVRHDVGSESLEDVLAQTHLRIPQSTPLTEPWSLCDAERAESMVIEQRREEALRRRSARGTIKFDPERFGDVTDFTAEAATEIVRHTAPRTHADANVVAVLRSTTGHYCCVYTDSTACANIDGRKHNTATTYFIVSRTAISQRCRCRCADKTCRDYKGPKHSIARELYRFVAVVFEADDAETACAFSTASTGDASAAKRPRYNDMKGGSTAAAAALASRLPPPAPQVPNPESPASRILDMFGGSAYGRFRSNAWGPPKEKKAKSKPQSKPKLGFAPEKNRKKKCTNKRKRD